ncbi:helix-turn-helix-domain containing protein type [Colletotrichum truncatum]|uniref:Helix-turn-helix-domain containing protein type n=1 Tax=Colletotrichum truncatum TaxID=5467 RepID=A0ACC3ZAV1_COLTU|nr:helix-turn-helix-domain containing protein type [Colletotrichum truncatum]KAF6783141.1 helix-turn-helix-domain containing protein type [Colletotrichum truncatum]
MVTLYNASIPMMIKYLGNLKAILTKAEEHIAAKNIHPEEMIKFRLIEDMRSLDYQVQSCCNTAKFIASRLADQENVFFEDDETTFPQLQSRVDRTVEILKAIPAEAMNGKEDAEVILPSKMGNFRFTGYSYIVLYACPNFHFHLSSAYCILRHLSVPLGAFDYLDSQRDLFVQA